PKQNPWNLPLPTHPVTLHPPLQPARRNLNLATSKPREAPNPATRNLCLASISSITLSRNSKCPISWRSDFSNDPFLVATLLHYCSWRITIVPLLQRNANSPISHCHNHSRACTRSKFYRRQDRR